MKLPNYSIGITWLQAEDTASSVVAVIHIDIMPPYTDAAVRLLHHYCRDSPYDAHNEAEHPRVKQDRF